MGHDAGSFRGRHAALCADITRDLESWTRLRAELPWVLMGEGARDSARTRAAFLATTLHHAYGAVETALVRIARVIDEDVPTGPSWHRELLARMARPFGDTRSAVLSEASHRLLGKLLTFRHFFRHAYGTELDLAELESLAQLVLPLDRPDPVSEDLGRWVECLQEIVSGEIPEDDEGAP